jgi:hypothetical protein
VVEGISRYAATELIYRAICFVDDLLHPGSKHMPARALRKRSQRGHKRREEEEVAETAEPARRAHARKRNRRRGDVEGVDTPVEEGSGGMTEAERISWATKEAYNDAVFRTWAAMAAHLLTYPLETVLNR